MQQQQQQQCSVQVQNLEGLPFKPSGSFPFLGGGVSGLADYVTFVLTTNVLPNYSKSLSSPPTRSWLWLPSCAAAPCRRHQLTESCDGSLKPHWNEQESSADAAQCVCDYRAHMAISASSRFLFGRPNRTTKATRPAAPPTLASTTRPLGTDFDIVPITTTTAATTTSTTTTNRTLSLFIDSLTPWHSILGLSGQSSSLPPTLTHLPGAQSPAYASQPASHRPTHASPLARPPAHQKPTSPHDIRRPFETYTVIACLGYLTSREVQSQSVRPTAAAYSLQRPRPISFSLSSPLNDLDLARSCLVASQRPTPTSLPSSRRLWIVTAPS